MRLFKKISTRHVLAFVFCLGIALAALPAETQERPEASPKYSPYFTRMGEVILDIARQDPQAGAEIIGQFLELAVHAEKRLLIAAGTYKLKNGDSQYDLIINKYADEADTTPAQRRFSGTFTPAVHVDD